MQRFRSMKTLQEFSSGAQPIQSGAASRHPADLQAETLDRIDGVARPRGIDRRLRAGVPRYASTNAVTLTADPLDTCGYFAELRSRAIPSADALRASFDGAGKTFITQTHRFARRRSARGKK